MALPVAAALTVSALSGIAGATIYWTPAHELAPQGFELVENPDMLVGIELRINGAFEVDLFDIDADGDPDIILTVGSGGENLLFLNGGATPVEPTNWGVIKAMYR